MVVHREESGDMMAEERIDMMMIMVPTQKFQQEINDLSGYCLPCMIRKFFKLASDVCRVVFDDC